MTKKLCYDVGMNNGDDSAYYLAKGMDVIAIEANPLLCETALKRFKDCSAINVVNVGVGPEPGLLPFFVHKTNSVMSTFEDPPRYDVLDAFETMPVKTKRLSDIIGYYGDPFYVKIDVEGFDAICLRDLLLRRIRPPYISAEAHTVETFCVLVAMGYEQFKLVNGASVHVDYADANVQQEDGSMLRYAFPLHSSGPFGEDIAGEWFGRDEALARWQGRSPGWYDLHAKL